MGIGEKKRAFHMEKGMSRRGGKNRKMQAGKENVNVDKQTAMG